MHTQVCTHSHTFNLLMVLGEVGLDHLGKHIGHFFGNKPFFLTKTQGKSAATKHETELHSFHTADITEGKQSK